MKKTLEKIIDECADFPVDCTLTKEEEEALAKEIETDEFWNPMREFLSDLGIQF